MTDVVARSLRQLTRPEPSSLPFLLRTCSTEKAPVVGPPCVPTGIDVILNLPNELNGALTRASIEFAGHCMRAAARQAHQGAAGVSDILAPPTARGDALKHVSIDIACAIS